MDRLFLALAGLNGFLGVMLGAFGAHGLRNTLASAPDGVRRMEVWETGAHYQLVHAVALAVVAAVSTRFQSQALPIAGYLFQAGIVLFSGSLYIIGYSGIRAFGAVTPFGGLCFLAGWISIIVAAFKQG